MASPQRPDIAAMQHTIPTPDRPNPVDLQAAAQQAVDRPHVDVAGRRFYFTRQLDMFDLAALGEAIELADESPIQAIGGINRCLRQWVDDYPGLVAAFRTVHTSGVTDEAMAAYGQLATDVFVALTARPTEAPAGSSDGRSQTSTSSKDEQPNGTRPSAGGAWIPAGSTPG
jgi:hypothetical protein